MTYKKGMLTKINLETLYLYEKYQFPLLLLLPFKFNFKLVINMYSHPNNPYYNSYLSPFEVDHP